MAVTRSSRTKTPKAQTNDSGGNGHLPEAEVAEPKPRASRGRTAQAVSRSPMPIAKIRQAAMLLKQVSDPTRLQVLMLLAEEERNVGSLCSDLGNQSQPAVSHHLALLRHGRLIEPRREGKNNVYSLTDEGRNLAETVRSLIG